MSPNPSWRGLAVPAGAAALLLSLAGCASSFFKVNPEGNAAQAPASPAASPATPASPASPAAAPPVAPPLARSPEPVATPLEPDPEPVASDSAGIARLAQLALVWHTVSLHHPAVAGHEDEWDGTLARHATAVRAATDEGRLAAAYTRMLDVLGDPSTRVERRAPAALTHMPASGDVLPDGTLLLRLPPSLPRVEADSIAVVRAVAARPSRVVIDLRGAADAAGSAGIDPQVHPQLRATTDAFVAGTGLVESLISAPLALPATRVRRTGAQGDVAVGRGTGALIRPGSMSSGWMQAVGRTLVPAASRAPRIVVIANAASVIPSAIAGLIGDRRALLVAEDRVTDESLVPAVRLAVAPGVAVRVRTGELVHRDGTIGLHADTVVPAVAAAGDSAPALRAALRLVRGASTPARLARDTPGPRFAHGSAALANDTVPYPYMGARILGGFRVWSVMLARHAHRESYDDDIGALFHAALPRLEAASNRQQYAAALRGLVASFDDSQVALRGGSSDLAGPAIAGFRARQIEGRTIVTAVDVRGEEAPRISVGSEITAVDGFPMAAWLLDRRRDVTASNDWTRTRDLMELMPHGREGDALLRVRDATGPERAVAMPRLLVAPEMRARRLPERSTNAIARLATDIAYLDLDRLDDAAASAAITGAAGTRAMVLDLRGRAPGWATVLRRLAVHPEFVVARVIQRALSAPCTVASPRDAARVCADERTSTPVVARLDTAGHYAGRVVVLIDERTQGEAEQLALALEAGANATFIGSSSAGAAADTVSMTLPGGLTLAYPTDEIRRADGGQLHRTGITPIVDARQTVRGVRTGKDDVIERATAWLQQGSDAPRRRR